MTRQMKQRQDSLPPRSQAKLVSLTTNPDFDTPRVLKAYAERFGADPNRWMFLTGAKKESRRARRRQRFVHPQHDLRDRGQARAVARGFRDYRRRNRSAESQSADSRYCEAAGVGTMSVTDLPVVNACLNGASAVFLGLGYYCIRRKNQAAHRNCMIVAFVLSTLFLACYIT